MKNFTLLFSVNLIVVIFGCAHGQIRYEKLRKIATSCTVGVSTQDPDGCNMCHCIENGVMICTRRLCGKKTGMFTPSRLTRKERKKKEALPDTNQTLKKFAENVAECTVGDRMKDYNGCNWCECVEAGVMICTKKRCDQKSTKDPHLAHGMDTDVAITASNSNLFHENSYNLREKTKDCTLDRKTISTPCHICKCAHHGAVKCVSIKGNPCKKRDKKMKSKNDPKLKLDLPVGSDYLTLT